MPSGPGTEDWQLTVEKRDQESRMYSTRFRCNRSRQEGTMSGCRTSLREEAVLQCRSELSVSVTRISYMRGKIVSAAYVVETSEDPFLASGVSVFFTQADLAKPRIGSVKMYVKDHFGQMTTIIMIEVVFQYVQPLLLGVV
jgi:hypothetical protein